MVGAEISLLGDSDFPENQKNTDCQQTSKDSLQTNAGGHLREMAG